MKKLLIPVVALMLLGQGCLPARPQARPAIPPPMAGATGEAAALRTERYEVNDSPNEPRCSFSFAYPVVEGDGAVVQELNRQLRIAFGLESPTSSGSVRTPKAIGDDYVDFCKRDLEEFFGVEADAEDAYDDHGFVAYENNTDFDVILNRRGILSIRINTYEYAGGVHGNPGIASVNLDLRTGRPLLLGSLVGSEHLRPLMAWVRQEHLLAYDTALYDEAKEEFRRFIVGEDTTSDAALASEGSFFIEDDGLLFFSNVYELAPYAAGQLMIEAPYEKIHDYLDLGGPIGRLVR